MRHIKIDQRITNRNKLTERYFNDVNQYDRVSVDKEVELANRIQQGDKNALTELITANLRFVISVAKQYSSHNSELLTDLISQGNIGLIDAAKTYDASRGFKFISYAVWHIRKEMLAYLESSTRTIRLPQSISRAITKAKKLEDRLEQSLVRSIEFDEIRDAFEEIGDKELSKMNFEKAYYFSNVDSLDAPLSEDGGSLNDIIEIKEDEKDHFMENSKILNQILKKCLTPKQLKVISYKFGLNGEDLTSWESIGAACGFSGQNAKSIYEKAIIRIRYYIKRNNINIENFVI